MRGVSYAGSLCMLAYYSGRFDSRDRKPCVRFVAGRYALYGVVAGKPRQCKRVEHAARAHFVLLSSASCGIAVALVCAFFDGHAVGGFAVPRILIFADAAIVSGEFVATVLYGLFPPAGASFASLATGDALALLLWWLGFVFCGIAAPLVLETIAYKRLSLPNQLGQAFACLAIASVLVLVGGACLRVGVVNVGSHVKMELRASIERPVQTDDTGEEWLL